LDGAAAALVNALNDACSKGDSPGRATGDRDLRTPLFALDVPSGVDADTGHAYGVAVRAALTLSFICAKPGLFTGRGRAAAGEVRVDALGLDSHAFEGIEPSARLVRPERLAHWLPPRARGAHKGRFGHVLCIGGDHGYGGALALCAEAAHRAGAGLVSAVTRAEHIPMLLARRPECMAHALGSDAAPDALATLLGRASALAIGPGLGQGAWGASLWESVLARRLPMVIDADALNLLARRDALRLPNAVLTPHPGEAARLLGVTVEDVERDRIQAARRLAARYDATVILKGAGTVVMSPSTEHRESIPILVDAGNPGMACGGMGDALTGIVAGLLAQFCSTQAATAPHVGSHPSGKPISTAAGPIDGIFAAAVCGALLHSAAADHAARDGGERGLLASDLFPYVRRLANPEPLR
jgi:NAD(P)H-hydrate epimerase